MQQNEIPNFGKSWELWEPTEQSQQVRQEHDKNKIFCFFSGKILKNLGRLIAFGRNSQTLPEFPQGICQGNIDFESHSCEDTKRNS